MTFYSLNEVYLSTSQQSIIYGYLGQSTTQTKCKIGQYSYTTPTSGTTK